MNRIYLLWICLLSTFLFSNAGPKWVGGDISLLTKYEEHGAIYYDENGARITDMLGYLKSQGLNAMRVRLFVDPSKANAEDQGEGVCQEFTSFNSRHSPVFRSISHKSASSWDTGKFPRLQTQYISQRPS